MKGAILAVGDELTCGYRLDTNSQVISHRLASVPVEVVLHLSVGDDMEGIHRALRFALEAAETVIITGGLGPTEDDLTRQAVAAYFGVDLVENAEALALLKERFARFRRVMPESNLIQARVPAGSQIIQNDRGTAAGFYLPVQDRHIFVTPGIPFEMEGMLEGFILPRLRELLGVGQHQRRAALKVYGLPESGINERIRPLMERGRNPLLGLLPHRGTITIEVVAAAPTAQEADALVEADLTMLRAVMGRYAISEDERELPQVLADLLLAQGLTIAVAELGTAGLVAARLTEPEGAERWLRGSVVFGSVADAWDWAGHAEGSTGDDVAVAMAGAARRAAGVHIGLGVGPFLTPPDSTPQRPYGVVPMALHLGEQLVSKEISFNGDRLRVREWAADAALAQVRWAVLEHGEGNGGQAS
jgi:nicotinamide-nucleotide amidase